ncbi:MAG: hypothetical protein AAF714_02465 [Pseudomonadota bacterium]
MNWTFIVAGFLALIALAILGRIMRCWLANPSAALLLTSHDPEQFPQVMAGRYAFMAAMIMGALIFGGAGALAFVFASLSGLGFYDGWVYGRVGKSTAKHNQAGLASLAAALACLALWAGA